MTYIFKPHRPYRLETFIGGLYACQNKGTETWLQFNYKEVYTAHFSEKCGHSNEIINIQVFTLKLMPLWVEINSLRSYIGIKFFEIAYFLPKYVWTFEFMNSGSRTFYNFSRVWNFCVEIQSPVIGQYDQVSGGVIERITKQT